MEQGGISLWLIQGETLSVFPSLVEVSYVKCGKAAEIRLIESCSQKCYK